MSKYPSDHKINVNVEQKVFDSKICPVNIFSQVLTLSINFKAKRKISPPIPVNEDMGRD